MDLFDIIIYIYFLRSIQLYFVSFFFSLEPVVWEIAALVRTESSLLTTDTLAVILVAGITKLIISLTFPSSPFPKKNVVLYFQAKLSARLYTSRLAQCSQLFFTFSSWMF